MESYFAGLALFWHLWDSAGYAFATVAVWAFATGKIGVSVFDVADSLAEAVALLVMVFFSVNLLWPLMIVGYLVDKHNDDGPWRG